MLTLTLQALVNGLVVGAIYGLIAIGLNLIFGVLRVVNFSHGEFVVAGSYLAWLLMHQAGLNPLLAVPVAFIVFGAAGYGLYYLLVPRLRRSDDPESASLLATYGLSIVVAAILLLAFEADPRSLGYAIEPASIMIGPIVVPTLRLVALALVLVLMGTMSWFLYRTLAGKALRAITMNPDAVQIVGINVGRLSALAFGVGLGLAAVSGVLTALVFPSFSPFAGADYTLIGFIVVVLGGLGHPVGAVVGALIFAVTEQVMSIYVNASLALAVGFAVLVFVLFVKPSGLFGKTYRR
ncbi:branched-chain amino acid ABC transporter permease [Ottowia sp.]|uniref:branched-chain amino acid ABC transporter permease n=1 Tax=Ottowia sp. TaxID=1898956 RepID=UPI0039E63F06